MGLFYKNPDPYYDEIARLQRYLRATTPGSEAYDKLLEQINVLQEQKSKNRILHRRVHMDLKKPIVTGGVFGLLMWFNHRLDSMGDMLTGQSKRNAEGLLSSAIKTFTSFKFW